MYEKKGTPFTQRPTCPTGVAVFVLLTEGVIGMRFKYLWLPGTKSLAAKGPILCVGIPVLATITLDADL